MAMTQEEELNIFQLISEAGTAKSAYMEAIKQARDGSFDKVDELFKRGDDHFLKSHDVHLSMISSAASGVESPATLMHVHAEDQMMSTEVTKCLGRELVDVYRVVYDLQKTVADLLEKLT